MTSFPWGKLSEGSSHHLAHHCADVAACFEAISELPVFRARLETAAKRKLGIADISRLSLFAFLHDLGKLHPEFQAKAFPDQQDQRRGHSAEGLAALRGEIDKKNGGDLIIKAIHNALPYRQFAEWSDESTLCNLAMAIFAHHGRPVKVSSINLNAWSTKPRRLENYDVSDAVHEIGNLLPDWFPQAFDPVAEKLSSAPSFQHLFCGLVALSDWIGSDVDPCQFSAELDITYMQTARDRARASIARIGLDSAVFRQGMTGTDFTDIAPSRTPRNGQAVIGDWPVDDQLIILEAETGSGKTEAALWRFARLFEAGKIDSLYFAVPTRAAAKQLHGRVHKAMKYLFGSPTPQTVLAIPGYLKAGAFEGQALPDFKVLWDDDDIHDHAMRWAAESSRRFLAATVAVGTVDQAMLAGLMVKHAHLRGAALSRSLLVIDEVHASDAYMTGIQKNLLDVHLGRGGHAMLMSATLGSAARNRWLGETNQVGLKIAQEIACPYPAIWGKTSPMKPVEPDGRTKTVRMTCLDDWSAAKCAALAIDAAQNNARVLVIRNTVQVAVDTFNAVQQQDVSNLLLQSEGRPALHHSRFAVEDRKRLDDVAEAALSPIAGIRPDNGIIVIGTQTLEQSLDICADYLISDLCPADVLLQRIGRLHRHKLDRPSGYETPQCVVLSPAGGLDKFASGKVFENGLGMTNGGGVYLNLHANELTRRMAVAENEWIIPDMNRYLVEGATHRDAIESLNDELGKEWQDSRAFYEGSMIADRQGGNRVMLDVALPFYQDDGSVSCFPDSDSEIRTRLGAEGVRVKFTEGMIGPFGQPVSEIACPAHWHVPVPETAVELREEDEGTLVFKITDEKGKCHSFKYGISGLSK